MLRLLKFLYCFCIATAQTIDCEYWRWYGVDMSSNITLLENNTGLLYHTGTCNITLFAVWQFLCTSVSECVYRCCADFITFYLSRTSSVKPRGGQSNYIPCTVCQEWDRLFKSLIWQISFNHQMGRMYLKHYAFIVFIWHAAHLWVWASNVCINVCVFSAEDECVIHVEVKAFPW